MTEAETPVNVMTDVIVMSTGPIDASMTVLLDTPDSMLVTTASVKQLEMCTTTSTALPQDGLHVIHQPSILDVEPTSEVTETT